MIDLIAMPETWDAVGLFNWFMAHAGYLFVFVLMVVESSFIPFPSEVVVPPAAYLATSQLAGADATGSGMNVYLVVAVATAGALVGSLINYYLAVWVGRPIVYKFADSRLGHACLIDRAKVDKAEAYFDKYGGASTFIGRLIPVVRQLISIPAGLARMQIGKFMLFTTLGAGIWNAVLATLGWWLGTIYGPQQLVGQIEHYNSYLTIAGFGLLGVCVLYICRNAFFKKHPSTTK